jgi:hypothetical protein
MITAMSTLPKQLRRSTTWDQGAEMSRHQEITMTTGMPIYFCYPYSPWQRGSNENTNGLLREYFPKSTELSFHGPGILENVAAELNRQPRKRHGYRTPAEVLAEVVSNPVKEFRCCRHHRNSPRFRDIFGGSGHGMGCPCFVTGAGGSGPLRDRCAFL